MEAQRTIRRVMEDGTICLLGRRYADERLLSYVGEHVSVEYDPNEMGSVTVFENIDTHIICEALEA